MKTYVVPSLLLFKVINTINHCPQPKLEYKRKISKGETVIVNLGGNEFNVNVPKDDNYDFMYVYSWNNDSPIREAYTITLNNGIILGKEYHFLKTECISYLII